jgi:hypothetical protein
MKHLIGTLILGGLLCTGMYAFSSAKPIQPAPPVSIREALQPASPISIREVLLAHNIPQRLEDLSAFSAEAVRLTSRPRGIDREAASFFERRISVVMAGNTYKRHMADPLRQREQFDLFDGIMPYHAVIEDGQQAEEAKQVTESQARGVEFGVKTFGLAPILKQLSDPATEVAYVGRTAYGQDKFDVKTATDRWTMYADMEHLICRIESGDKAIEYAGYRFVEGVRLPLIQRLSIGGQLIQELVFTKIAFNPKLPPGYFSREALTKQSFR